MKRKYLLIALTAIMALSASAERKWLTCIVCGKEIYIDTNDLWKVDWMYHQSRDARGYICPKQKCKDQSVKWHQEDEKRAREFAAEAVADIKSSKELKKAVNVVCNKEKYALLALKGKPEKQIEFMKKLIAFCVKNKCHAEDIWYVFAAYADIDAVKYYWPDPSDEKVYLASKKRMEKNAKKAASSDEPISTAKFLNNFFAGDNRIRPSKKNGPCALAVGRAKKDNQIRFVESEGFAAGVLAAALTNNRKDVVTYLLKQTGGVDESFRRDIVDKWMTAVGETEYARIKIKERIAATEKAKKEADDKFDVAKMEKQIKSLNKVLDSIVITAVSADTLSPVLSNMTPSEAAQYFRNAQGWGVKGSEGADAYQEIMEGQAKSSLQAAENASQNQNLEKLYGAIFSGGVEANIELSSVSKSLNDFCAKSTGELGKWYKWREDLKKNWRAGVVDPWIPAFVSGKESDQWTWEADVLSKQEPGKISGKEAFVWYMEPCIPSAEHPGYLSFPEEKNNLPTKEIKWSWKWVPGTPDVRRPGYFAGEKKDTFVWQSGVPDPERIGMVTGAKEGEWVLAPGFKKQKDGTVRWVAGLTDPARPGIVSTEKMFYWVPDGKHLWTYDEKESSSTKKTNYHSEHYRQVAELIVYEKHPYGKEGAARSAKEIYKIAGQHRQDVSWARQICEKISSAYSDLEECSSRDRNTPAQFYLSLEDYDEIFRKQKEDLSVRDDYKALDPTVEKILVGNQHR